MGKGWKGREGRNRSFLPFQVPKKVIPFPISEISELREEYREAKLL